MYPSFKDYFDLQFQSFTSHCFITAMINYFMHCLCQASFIRLSIYQGFIRIIPITANPYCSIADLNFAYLIVIAQDCNFYLAGCFIINKFNLTEVLIAFAILIK
jgi:hypothetical protein